MISRRLVIPVLTAILTASGPAVAIASAAPPPSPALGQDRDDWNVAPPREYNDVQRRGFHDGIEGARRDFGNHRRPDPDNRDEFRHPENVPPPMWNAYRDAFRRGYQIAASRLWREPAEPVAPAPPPPPVDRDRHDGDNWGMRGLDNDAERRGFHEGGEEAHRDFQFQRRPDPDDHEEFRNPPVPPDMVGEYREGFMRGYEVAMSQLNGEGEWRQGGEPDHWAPPQSFNEMERSGFQDGIQGANRDYGNHRRPSVFNRDEYRRPPVPPEAWNEYREGFRRGYEMAANRLWGQDVPR